MVRSIPRVRLYLWGALALGIGVFLVYAITLAPSITWRNDGADSGDLVTAAFTLGIPHPPGYPLYTLVAAVFAHLPFSEPAHNVNLFSALAAAGAVMLFYLAARALMRQNQSWAMEISAVSVALTLAFTPLFWSQAVLAEVYALNAFLVAALLAVLLAGTTQRLALSALIFGLGLAHHPSIVLLVPSALGLLWDARWSRSQIFIALLFLIVPLLSYLYLPLRALTDPPINWGDPRTLEGFWWTISAAPYHSYLMNFASSDVLGRITASARILFQQFNGWGVALGLWGVAQMWSSEEPRARRQGVALALGVVLTAAYSIVYVTRDSYVYLLPAFIIFALWIVFGIHDVARRFSATWARGVLVGVLIVMPTSNLMANFSGMDLSRDRQAFDYAQTIFARVPNDAVILADGDAHLFALQYYRYVIARDSHVSVISADLLQFDWYYAQVRRTMPDLGVAVLSYQARLNQIVERNWQASRAVYSTTPGGWFAAYWTLQEGELFRIMEHRR